MKLFFPHFCSVFLFLFAAAHSSAQRTQLRLATANDALLRNDLKAFYMPTSLTTRPPESGSYGFVRNSRDFGEAGSFYTRFHEGLDIRPLHRNASKIPTDVVRPIMNGTVAYVNSAASLPTTANMLLFATTGGLVLCIHSMLIWLPLR